MKFFFSSDENSRKVESASTKSWPAWQVGIAMVGALGISTVTYFAARQPEASPELSLQTAVVELKTLRAEVRANGVVQPIRVTNLSPQESGRLTHLYVDEGDLVGQGQLIAQMDGELLEAQVRQFEASFAQAQANLEQKLAGSLREDILKAEAELEKSETQVLEAESRMALASERVERVRHAAEEGALSQDLLDQALTDEVNARESLAVAQANLKVARQELLKQRNGSRPEEIEQARAEVEQAEAQLEFYRAQLDSTFIRAPFDGIITRRFAQEGNFVTPTTSASSNAGATSTSIVELSAGLEIEAKVPESSVSRIKPGQAVDILVDAYPNETFEGQVRLVSPRAVQEDNVTSFRVQVSLRTGQVQLKPAMNVRLVFEGEQIQDVLTIPTAGITVREDGQEGVWMLNGEQSPYFQPVKVGFISGSEAEVLEGVSEGQKILLSPPFEQRIPGVDDRY